MFSRIFLGLLIFTAGFLMIYKNKSLVSFTGRNSWGEKLFGSGGTFTLYKILGILVMAIAFLYLIGKLDEMFTPLLHIFRPGV
jgi:hypothetical protein